ncbi:MAG: cache domain-containing protein [Chloroflexi bacterium]|nr:cache domain-containing protein [Chloroflexota bacterium]
MAMVLVAAAVAAIVSVAANRAYGGQEQDRAAGEAGSFADHSGLLATGDAFAGYIQLLRDAEDTQVRSLGTPSDVRTAALRRLLELNTNRFSGLAVVGLDGRVVSATDVSLLDATIGQAFAAVRANQGNANSDIVLDPDGRAHVDYASILVDVSGEKWGVLVARADPNSLWRPTLSATVDGGQNILINRDGQLAAGVSRDVMGQPWKGRDFAGGTIRGHVGGVDSICGLEAIAPGTQIDHEWTVASCLPAQRVLASAGASSTVWLTAAAAATLLSLVGLVVLRLLARRPDAREQVEDVQVEESEAVLEEYADTEPEPVAPEGPPPPNIDARTLIAAYEARNARLAARLRESVQARLLVASSRVDEAIQLQSGSPDLMRVMLERAEHELDDLNEHELRALGQELYPDLVRLGLPAALRALRKDVADVLDVEVDAAADVDSVDEDSERAIGMPRRIVMYRLVLEALQQFADIGLEACTVSLHRSTSALWLAVKGRGAGAGLDASVFDAAALAVEAYGGDFRLEHSEDTTEVAVQFAVGDVRADVATGGEAQPFESVSAKATEVSSTEAA